MLLLYGIRYSRESNATDWTFEKCIKPLKRIENQPLEDNFVGSLMEFGQFIHKSIVNCSRSPYKDTHAFGPGDFILHKTYNFSPLSAFLFGLATGKDKVDFPTVRMPINPDIYQTAGEKAKRRMVQKEFFGVAAASDIILRATVNTPGHFQLMIGRQLNMVPIPKALRDLLSISCVAPSRTFSHKALAKAVVSDMSKDMPVEPGDVTAVYFDNLGMKEKADHDPTKIGYIQRLAVIDEVNGYEALMKERRLYSDDLGSRLSREPSNTWEALNREEGAAERLTQIKPEDTIKLTKSIAECILKNIEDVLAGKFCTGSKRLRTTKEHYTELTTREFEEEHPGAVSMEDVIALDIYQLSDEVFGWERYSSAPEVAGFVERTGG